MQQGLARQYGAKSSAIVDALRQVYPNAKPTEIFGHVEAGLRYRIATVTHARRKAAQNAAPVYTYIFAWRTPILDGRPRAFHRSDIAFGFDNTDRCAHLTGGTEEARSLAARMSSAWIAFARTGDPNHRGLPKWPAFTADSVPTMILDDKSEVKYDHDRRARQVFEEAVVSGA